MNCHDNSELAASFAACVRRLEEPDESAIRDAFREIPKRGTIEILCAWRGVSRAMRALGAAGFIAIEAAPASDGRRARLIALKGKAGACYETGRSATYLGAAAGTLDDDGHLLFGAMRVCEKTGGLYTLPPYRGLISVSPPDSVLLARLDTDPLPFDCNTFERDAGALAARLRDRAPDGLLAAPVIYAGPFRLLILDDGSMLPRGVPVLIAESQRRRLVERERLLAVPVDLAGDARPADSFLARYASEGALCLLETAVPASAPSGVPPGTEEETSPPSDLSVLDALSPAMRRRLQRMIERGDAYFILSGSDPRDANGCCPSDDVGEANRLVEAGILSCHQPPAHPEACTTAVYAFAGEIHAGEKGGPAFAPRAELRRHVADALARRVRLGSAAWLRRALGVAVAGLIVVGIAAAVRQSQLAAGDRSESALERGDRRCRAGAPFARRRRGGILSGTDPVRAVRGNAAVDSLDVAEAVCRGDCRWPGGTGDCGLGRRGPRRPAASIGASVQYRRACPLRKGAAKRGAHADPRGVASVPGRSGLLLYVDRRHPVVGGRPTVTEWGIGGAFVLGLLTALQPCALATVAGGVAWSLGWGGAPRAALARGLALVAGLCAAYAGLALAATRLALALPLFALRLTALLEPFQGPLLLAAGALVAGVFGRSRQVASRASPSGGGMAGSPAGAFFFGLALAGFFCPATAGIFFLLVIPAAVAAGAPGPVRGGLRRGNCRADAGDCTRGGGGSKAGPGNVAAGWSGAVGSGRGADAGRRRAHGAARSADMVLNRRVVEPFYDDFPLVEDGVEQSAELA